jgi:hypothetical protein
MHTEVTPQKINKVMESRFGFSIDYDNLSFAKAQRLHKAISENMQTIRKSFGSHSAEKNPKYVELMLVREGLDKWMHSEQGLFESEIGASEAKLAAQDIVNSLQKMVEDIGKMQNEQVPALVGSIRDQIGMEQSEAFKASIKGVLDSLYSAVASGKDQAESAVLQLAGDQQPGGDMSMGGMDDGMGGAPELGGDDLGGEAPAPESDLDGEDGFDGTDAAIGGSEVLGRGRRNDVSESKAKRK